MKNLILKEIKLVVSPAAYCFMLLSALLLIPQYPYCVGTSYCVFAIFISFGTAQANKDHEFTATLPVPRRHIVLAKHFTVAYIECLQLLAAIPFALLTSLVLNKNGNIVGMDANVAFFGFAMTGLAIFNIIFLPSYFKTGYKTGIPLAIGLTGYLVFIVASEVLVAVIPTLNRVIDGLNVAYIGYRFIVLAVGAILYVGSMMLSYNLSVKNFERVSL